MRGRGLGHGRWRSAQSWHGHRPRRTGCPWAGGAAAPGRPPGPPPGDMQRAAGRTAPLSLCHVLEASVCPGSAGSAGRPGREPLLARGAADGMARGASRTLPTGAPVIGTDTPRAWRRWPSWSKLRTTVAENGAPTRRSGLCPPRDASSHPTPFCEQGLWTDARLASRPSPQRGAPWPRAHRPDVPGDRTWCCDGRAHSGSLRACRPPPISPLSLRGQAHGHTPAPQWALGPKAPGAQKELCDLPHGRSQGAATPATRRSLRPGSESLPRPGGH